MAEFDIVIRGGTIVDGTRVPKYRGDVAIKGGKIAKMGRIKSHEGARVVDATGLIVAPGTIDTHTHFDAQIHWDPYCTLASWHGVTSVTLGNCGFGLAPVLSDKDFDLAMKSLSRNEAIPLATMQAAITPQYEAKPWRTFAQWMDHVDSLPLGINVSQLLPVSQTVAYALGGYSEAKSRIPSEKETKAPRLRLSEHELQKTVEIFHEGMKAGAMGFGSQRLVPESLVSVQRDIDGTPLITDVLPDEFFLAWANALRDHDHGFIQFLHGTTKEGEEGAFQQRDMAFSARLAETSGHVVLFNVILPHDEVSGPWRSQLKWVAEISAKGIPMYAVVQSHRIPYVINFQDWSFFDDSPHWRGALIGTTAEKRANLAKPELRQALRAEYDAGTPTRDFIFGKLRLFTAYRVASPELKKYEGMTVEEIAQREKKHVIDAILDVTVADNLQLDWIGPVFTGKTEHMKEIFSSPLTIPGVSDGGAHVKFLTVGAYPTDLLTWVREAQVMTLEEAHFRLSALPAWAAQWKDRGTLREGMAADIVVYDFDKLKILPMEIVHDLPAGEWRRITKADGYRTIMVNGQVTFEDGKCTGATPGQLIRGGKVY